MDYKISLFRRFRNRHLYHGELAPGLYAVPEQISDALAKLAIGQGVARRIEIEKPAPPAPPVKPKRARRKTAAPENKLLGHARDNKQVLV